MDKSKKWTLRRRCLCLQVFQACWVLCVLYELQSASYVTVESYSRCGWSRWRDCTERSVPLLLLSIYSSTITIHERGHKSKCVQFIVDSGKQRLDHTKSKTMRSHKWGILLLWYYFKMLKADYDQINRHVMHHGWLMLLSGWEKKQTWYGRLL